MESPTHGGNHLETLQMVAVTGDTFDSDDYDICSAYSGGPRG